MSGAPSGTPATPSGNGSTAAASTSTDTASQAAATVATTAAANTPASQTPSSPPDPVAAAAAAALSSLCDIAGDQNADDLARIEACKLIQSFADDAVVHALIDSYTPPATTSS